VSRVVLDAHCLIWLTNLSSFSEVGEHLHLYPSNSSLTSNSLAFPDFESDPKKEKKAPNRDRCLQIIDRLQISNPEIFTPRAAYDGQHIMYRSTLLPLTNNAAMFNVHMGQGPPSQQAGGATQGRKGKPIRVRLTKVADINTRYV